MKIVVLVCVLVAGSQAFDCSGNSFTVLDRFLCAFEQTASSIGNTLLHDLQTEAGQTINDMIQHIAEDPAYDEHVLGLEQIFKVIGFISGHHDLVHDLGHYLRNITKVTISKITNLAREFERNPSQEILAKINAYLTGHHFIQNEIKHWIEQNVPILSMLATHEMVNGYVHKRSTSDLLSQVASVGKNLTSSFSPVVSTLQGLLSGLGTQLKSFFESLLPSSEQLQEAFKPHLHGLAQHGTNLLNTASGTLDAVKEAIGDIMHQAANQSNQSNQSSTPSLSGLASHLGSALSSLWSHKTTSAY